MITKFELIRNLAVFRDFKWDNEVLKADGSVVEFSHINILYGRNYSGKTTLSRLLRATRTGVLSDKYGRPDFKIQFRDGKEVNHTNYQSCRELVRVFNEDFVKENLKFIADPEASIVPFALIGDDNIKIEGEIEALNNEIGSDVKGAETGLRAKFVSANNAYATAKSVHQKACSTLDEQLKEKAIGRENGIKYKSDRFGDQNYTKPKLETEILSVIADGYTTLADGKIKDCENLIQEKTKNPIPLLSSTSLTFGDLSFDTQLLVTKKVGAADKIEALVKDAVLNRWVRDGKGLHKDKRENCVFCGNTITEDRWAQLDKHFDEESDSLEKDIDALLLKVKNEEEIVAEGFGISKELFYAKFHDRLDALSADYARDSKLYLDALKALATQLNSRKADIINAKTYKEYPNHSEKLQLIWTNYETLRTESNTFTGALTKEQTKSKAALRLHEVYTFASTINYTKQIKNIKELKKDLQTKDDATQKIAILIQEKLTLVEAKKREMNDEEKGAIKVNEYLTHFFGHKFLSFEAKENEGDESGSKSIRFEVIRDGEKAYHLSEGECSLLAFCYFLAKLDDIETRGTKPIIWIDDPISSLDANHIFFVYSLLFEEIVSKGAFLQLFISTHNLEFLKYLKRLKGSFLNHNQRMQDYDRQFFVVERALIKSSIKLMPEYLREYVTEFNYLFDQIYKCSKIATVTDENYPIVYNFPNNARKFLEIFLYYKYPHGTNDRHGSTHMENMTKFFHGQSIPAVLTNRINNEYSHLAGSFERGAIPIDASEMVQVAELIIDRLRDDRDQFNAFLTSIGAPETERLPEGTLS